MSGDGRERLQALWVRYLAGDAEAARELGEEVRAGTPLAKSLAADREVHRLLDALGRSTASEEAFVGQVNRLVAAEASAERFVSAVDQRIDAAAVPVPPAARSRRWPLVVAPLALAAAAAVVLWPRAHHTVDRARATLVAGTLQLDQRSLQAGEHVPDEVALSAEDARACLRLPDGSQVCLERGARLRLQWEGDDRRVVLESGKVAAIVAHQKPGATFTVRAPAGDATAIGTAYSVEVADDGAAMITRVVQGTVAVGGAATPLAQRPRVRAHEAFSATNRVRWRMSSEEERDEWSLIRAHVVPALLAREVASPAPASSEPRVDAGTPPGAEVAGLLQLADALRARGRLRDAQGICDGLARRYPGRPDIERIAAELRLPPPAQPWNATPAVYRINAGGRRYLDPRGNTWSADEHYKGGHAGEFREEIDGTDMDPLYQSERMIFPGETLSYNLPVADGRYVVRLHFAEIWAGTVKRDMRRFDVIVEGEKVLAGYDIAAEVGPMTATVEQLVTSVRDGSLDIEFRHVLENPKISAIEVLALAPDAAPPPEPAPPTVFPPLPLAPTDALYRVNAGGREYVDPHGRRWEADSYFNDSGLGAAKYVEIAGTELDPLYQTERRSFVLPTRHHLVYSFPVPPGRYLLRLHFVQLFANNEARRDVFDVLVEKAEVFKGLDVLVEAGLLTALVKEVETTVTDGALDLSFRAIVGRPKVAAIEVIPVGGAAAAPGCAFVGSAPTGRWVIILGAVWLVLRGTRGRRRGGPGTRPASR
jgi:ferric-dicitrate binding protein FerR (iron transport regulator)